MDAALDFYNDLVAHVQGKLRNATTAVELNAALHEVLAGAWLSLDHAGTFWADFRLRPDAETVREGGILPEFGYGLPRAPGAAGPDLPEPPARVASRTPVEEAIELAIAHAWLGRREALVAGLV